MTKSTITREQLEEWVAQFDEDGGCDATDRQLEALIRQSLAAMDSEPVAWTWHYREQWHVTNDERRAEFVAKDGDVAVLPLYRHAQPTPVLEREPIAWLNDAYLARGVVDGEAGSEDAGSGYIPVYREAGPQPAPVVPEEKPIPNTLSMYAVDAVAAIAEVKGWNACRATMLQAFPVCTCPSGDGSLRWPCPVHPGNSPVIPDGYVMVPKEPTQAMCAAFNDSDYGRKSLRERYVAMLAAAPQEPKS